MPDIRNGSISWLEFAPKQSYANLGYLTPLLCITDLSLLHRLHQIAVRTDVQLDYMALSEPASSAYQKECQRILGLLQQHHLYQEARLFAESSLVRDSTITVNQVGHISVIQLAWKFPLKELNLHEDFVVECTCIR